jgi:iron complex outermembrane receptor protein
MKVTTSKNRQPARKLNAFWRNSNAIACLALTVFLLSRFAIAASAESALDQVNFFDIQANTSLEDALLEWGEKVGVTVMINTPTVEHRVVRALKGHFSARKALSLLLQESGLTYTEDQGRVRVIPIAALTKSGFRDVPFDSVSPEASDFQLLNPSSGGDESLSGAIRNGESKERGLPEVVVSAQKVTQNLQDVPATVQVLSGAQLESHGLVDLVDYAKEIPGLYIQSAYGPGSGFPVIRGLATGADATSLVGIFLDDIPFTPSSSVGAGATMLLDPDPTEIDHIEVLEGPQSTLYGASAEGGLIKYVTKKPDLENITGSVQMNGSQVDSGGTGYGVRGSVNIPLITGESAVRASVFYRQDPGFITNTFNDQKNVNWADVEGGQLSALFKISDSLEMTVTGLVQHIYAGALNSIFVDPNTLQPSLGSLAFTSHEPTSQALDTRALADTLKWDLEFATLTNIASYAENFSTSSDDFSILAQVLHDINPSIPPTPPGTYAYYRNETGSTRWTDELRLASAPGRLEYLLGAFYTHERDYNNEVTRGTDANGQPVAVSSPFYSIFDEREDFWYKEWALFADLTYHLTNQVEGTVGIRHASNDQSNDFRFFPAALTGAVTNQVHSTSDAKNTYLATLSYMPTSSLTAYLRAASAYRPGGSQYLAISVPGISGVFGPDTLWNYEAGVKGSLFDQRATYSVDIFDMRWKNLQLSVVNGALLYVTNVGSARSEGAEASVNFIPLPGLTVGVKAAYIDAIITSDVPSINAVNGQPLPYSPRWTGSTVADYRMTTSGGISPNVGLTYSYRGQANTGFTGPAGIFGASGIFQLPSYATLDLRAGFDWSRYSFIARVVNVTNKYGLTKVADDAKFPVSLEGTVIQPRTFGISVAAHF